MYSYYISFYTQFDQILIQGATQLPRLHESELSFEFHCESHKYYFYLEKVKSNNYFLQEMYDGKIT